MSDPTLDLSWRARLLIGLTPDETQMFAEWAYREIDRLRQERDGYLDRALAAEATLREYSEPERNPGSPYDTTAAEAEIPAPGHGALEGALDSHGPGSPEPAGAPPAFRWILI